MIDLNDPNLVEKLMQVDPLQWASRRNLQLSDGVSFELSGRPYLVGLVGCDKKIMSAKKGSQVCITTSKYLEALHACVYRRFDKNIIYMLPTVSQAETLAKVSFDPIFRFNKWLKKMVSNDSVSVKTVNGRSIVFVGAKSQKVGDSSAKDSINLRSIPADAVYRDEIDLMDEDMVDMSKQRLNASRFRIECNFGSPTVPGFGIDLLYDQGDQRKWQIKCTHCGKHTSLVESFPNSIIKVNGRWIRACVHCHKEIFVCDGDWIPEYPDRREASFWVDGLISPMADLEGYMHRFHNSDGTRLAEFQRSILGLATIEATCQLSVQQVLSQCRADGLKVYSDEPTCMGVDVGEVMHVVIGRRTGANTHDILYVGKATDFGQIHDIAEKMNVQFAVIDKGPDIHGVKEFQKREKYPVYRCQYSEQMSLTHDFDRETRVVKCNRNELCDRVHDAFQNDKISIPRDCPDIKEFAEQLTKLAKDTQRHPDTGLPKTRWVKIGNKEDHYYHAAVYFLLAATQTAPRRAGYTPQKIKIKNNPIVH